MARLLVYYAHPGHGYSRVNKEMAKVAVNHANTTFCDLYAEYPRFNIDVNAEQQRLVEHDVIILQHPLFWYSTPSIMKEWIDLVLEHGFAFGSEGDKLKGKVMMNALSAAGTEEAYTKDGYQHYPLRTFLTPLEQTARLCQMSYATPYVLYSALKADEDKEIREHVEGYKKLLDAICKDQYQFEATTCVDVVSSSSLNQFIEV